MSIEICELSFKYKTASKYAIWRATCRAESHGTTAIVGRSGVGKSTLMALMSGIYNERDELVGALEGHVTINGCSPNTLRGPQVISWVPQSPALLDHMTVAENVTLPLTIDRRQQDLKEEMNGCCERILEKLEMRDQINARPRELSGGMRTRVAMARALISRPKYLFLDEPFVGLDVASRWIMCRLLREERSSSAYCTVLTTHEIPEAMLLADRVLIIGRERDATTIEVVNNRPVELGICKMDDLLVEARNRARYIERVIYGSGGDGLGPLS